MVIVEKGGQRPAEHHMPHGEIHEDEQKPQGGRKPPLQHRRLPVLQGIFLRRQLCGQAPCRPAPGCFSGPFR